jgi:hypothetical protein
MQVDRLDPDIKALYLLGIISAEQALFQHYTKYPNSSSLVVCDEVGMSAFGAYRIYMRVDNLRKMKIENIRAKYGDYE